ncbi:MAG: UDP-N-acetylglucosamine 1-carboxyvinyltransferase [Acidobacteriota bacterium]
MDKLVIEGRARACGRVKISGSKNATLPIMAACLLARSECILHRVPNLEDVLVMEEVLRTLGVKVIRENGNLIINSENISSCEIPEYLSRKMRASNLVMGALLGRYGSARVSYPGGCAIGQRPMDIHLKGFRELGYEIEEQRGFIGGYQKRNPGGEILLDFPSVGATENLMMAAAISDNHTVIRNAAREPEIVDLQNFLNRMGARIRGAGLDVIRIEGVPELLGVEHEVIPDRIEAGTFMVLAAISAGNIIIENAITEHLEPIIAKLREVGAEITKYNGSTLRVTGNRKLGAVDIKTMPYPGFPTDLQSQVMALLTTVEGSSVVVESIFENRFMHVNELRRMGADIRVEGRVAIIKGGKRLQGAAVEATDLRAGAALILAATAADGQTAIEGLHHIDRGYENIEDKVKQLGVNITRIKV